jgi:hypothetical protein
MGPALSRGSSVLSNGYYMLHAAYLHPAAHPYLHKADPFFQTPGEFGPDCYDLNRTRKPRRASLHVVGAFSRDIFHKLNGRV